MVNPINSPKLGAKSMNEVMQLAAPIKLLALDVDGVLSDGRLYYGADGEELKAFYTPDGLGIKLLQDAGVDCAIITGRSSPLVQRRASELGIKHVVQGRDDKWTVLESLLGTLQLNASQAAYMGDDLPDLRAIKHAGLGITPANGHDLLAQHCDYQTTAEGGSGAVREVCELILRAQGKLTAAFEQWQ